jgi:membrane protease YdiL (CAAX protease family)
MRKAIGRAEYLLPRTSGERAFFAAVSITAGCVEELIYRGYIFWYVEAFWGTVAALVASSLLFGLVHLYLGRVHAVRNAFLGLLLGIVVLLAGSLWPAIAIHAMMDLVAGDLGWRALAGTTKH